MSSAPAPPLPDARPTSRTPVVRGRTGWRVSVGVVAALVVLPVVLVAGSVLTPSIDVWTFLWETGLLAMLRDTVVVMVGVVAGATVLGAGLAWLVATYRFPGRRVLSWLLVLPLAVPSYILAFVAVNLLDAPGPLQTFARDVLGWQLLVPAPQGIAITVVVMSLALYPYVYLLARAALTEQARATYVAARTLGHGPLRAARRVVLPLARPSLAAAGALIAMETLTDFATIQYFNVRTVSVAVYQVWNGMFDRAAAAELAAVVLVFAVTIIVVERALRGRASYAQTTGAAPGIDPVRLTGWKRWAATVGCVAVVGIAFVAPVLRLVTWTSADVLEGLDGGLDPRYLQFLGNSLLVAGAAAAACVVIAVVVTNATRLAPDRWTRGFARLTTIGYAVPGPVVAIGVLVVLAGLDTVFDLVGLGIGASLVTGSVVALVVAYVIRFLALSNNAVEASMDKVSPSMTNSALSLGASPGRVAARVHAPLARSGLAVAFVLVAVDALKELPVVLLLRPFGFSTLAVWVYELASESLWDLVGLPALTVVAVASLPLVLLVRGRLAVEDEPDRPRTRREATT